MNIQDIAIIANGRWESTLNSLGVIIPENKKNGACPCCGGKDRFRFDNKEGRGTFYCNQCGAGDGFTLVSKALNLSVKDAANVIDNIVGGNKPLLVKRVVIANSSTHQEAANKAAYILSKSLIATDHTYLTNKGVQAHSIYVSSKGDLVIPIFSPGEQLSSLQFISPDGKKRMLGGGKIKGCYGSIGTVPTNDNLVLLCEGYATAATLYECLGLPVFYCFNASNIYSVAEMLVNERTLNPIICADNDSHLQKNIGAEKAIEASRGLILQAVMPDDAGDFNDLMLARNKQAVIDTFKEVL